MNTDHNTNYRTVGTSFKISNSGSSQKLNIRDKKGNRKPESESNELGNFFSKDI